MTNGKQRPGTADFPPHLLPRLQAFSDNELETAFSPFRKREEVSSAKAREFQRCRSLSKVLALRH